MKYLISIYNRQTFEHSIGEYTETNFPLKVITWDIPKRKGCTKTLTRKDSFTGCEIITTITRIE